MPGDALAIVEAHHGVGGSTRDLEHEEVARDAAPLLALVARRRGDVVGRHHDPGFESVEGCAFGRQREVLPISKFITSPA